MKLARTRRTVRSRIAYLSSNSLSWSCIDLLRVVPHECGLAEPEDRLGEPYGCDSSRDIVHAHDACTLKNARDGGREAAFESSTSSCVERLADEILVGYANQQKVTQPGDFAEAAYELERVVRVLVQVQPGIDDDALERHPAADSELHFIL